MRFTCYADHEPTRENPSGGPMVVVSDMDPAKVREEHGRLFHPSGRWPGGFTLEEHAAWVRQRESVDRQQARRRRT